MIHTTDCMCEECRLRAPREPQSGSQQRVVGALDEMRHEAATSYLIWDNGVLHQLWEQDWAKWDGHYWRHRTEKVWKPVPQRPNAERSEPPTKTL